MKPHPPDQPDSRPDSDSLNDLYAPSETAFEATGVPIGRFSLTESFRLAWDASWKNFSSGLILAIIFHSVLAVVVIAFYAAVIGVAVAGVDDTAALLFILGVFIAGVGSYGLLQVLFAGVQMFGIGTVRRKGVVEDLFLGFRRFVRVFSAALLIYLLKFCLITITFLPAVLGMAVLLTDEYLGENEDLATTITGILALLIFPAGFYLDGRFSVVYPLILEREEHIIESMVHSWRMSGAASLRLVVAHAAANAVLIVGYVCCGAGILLTMPFYAGLMGAVSVQLLGEQYRYAGQRSDTVGGSIEIDGIQVPDDTGEY